MQLQIITKQSILLVRKDTFTSKPLPVREQATFACLKVMLVRVTTIVKLKDYTSGGGLKGKLLTSKGILSSLIFHNEPYLNKEFNELQWLGADVVPLR
mmetsp:Transcript_18083/g.26525  ORF Transcript_18083/g.26525 Transcript_18083/m.26525 type:complete len:98 (-) Transcript_18083:274-567(-)